MGKDISRYNEAEKEVLFKREVQFHVDDVIIMDGKYYYYLKEIK